MYSIAACRHGFGTVPPEKACDGPAALVRGKAFTVWIAVLKAASANLNSVRPDTRDAKNPFNISGSEYTIAAAAASASASPRLHDDGVSHTRYSHPDREGSGIGNH